jgi:hypothetical protein
VPEHSPILVAPAALPAHLLVPVAPASDYEVAPRSSTDSGHLVGR